MAERSSVKTIMWFIMERKYKRFAELGVSQGKTLIAMLNYAPVMECLQEYHAIDIFLKPEHYKNACKLELMHDQLQIHKGRTEVVVDLFPDGYFDIVFVDADHSTESVRADIINWMPKVKFGGVLLGHDINYGCVRRAVEEIFIDICPIRSRKLWSFEVSRNYFYKIKHHGLRRKMEAIHKKVY